MVTDMADVGNVGNVAKISGTWEGETLEFVKQDGVWYYSGDPKFPVKQSLVDTLVEDCASLAAERALDGGDELSYYGLDQSANSVTLTSGDGTITTVLIGNSLEDGSYYARKDGDTQAYTISAALPGHLDKDLYDYIQLEEFPAIAGADIREITVTKGETEYHIEKKTMDEEGNIAWYKDSSQLEENKMESNSPGNALADSLSGLYVQDCAAYHVKEEELADYGLDQPNAVISYTYEENGEMKELTLQVGSLDVDESYYFTRQVGSDAVNMIGKSVLDKCLNVEL